MELEQVREPALPMANGVSSAPAVTTERAEAPEPFVAPQGRPKRAFLTSLAKYLTNHAICHIPSYTVRHFWYRRVLGWQLGRKAVILMNQYVEMFGVRSERGNVKIGRNSIINTRCYFQTPGKITIGDNVSISIGVSLVTGGHDITHPDFAPVLKPIVIEDHVWIGMHATILGGVTIRRGAVVCAGAVVRNDVPENAVVDGVPAKVVGRRRLQNMDYTLRFKPLFE